MNYRNLTEHISLAWWDGYQGREFDVPKGGDVDWYFESYIDGRDHRKDQALADEFFAEQAAQTIAIRAKFKQIREDNRK